MSCRFRRLRLRDKKFANPRSPWYSTMEPRAKCWAMPLHSWIAKARCEERLVFLSTSPNTSGRSKRCRSRRPGWLAWRGSATMGELTASIAHEINQPLAAVTTYAMQVPRCIGLPFNRRT